MVKKLAAVMLAAVMMTSTAAFAQNISGTLNGDSISVVTEDKNKLILNGYDENGKLAVSRMFTSETGIFDIPSELSEYRLRASFIGGGVYDVDILTATPSATEAPASTKAPETAETPAPAKTPEPTEKPQKTYPDIYERQVDAVEAIAVVDEVSYGEDENSEECYYIDVLYQGSEMRIGVKDTVTVSEASDEFYYMLGQDMSSLQRGDVICFASNLSGEISRVGFVYRPLDVNIATDGNDYGSSFERLISKNGGIAGRNGWTVMTYGGRSKSKNELAFGVISDRQNKSLTLLGADGDENKALDLSLDNNTIVYVCDMSARRELSVSGISSLERSSIPRNAADDDGFVAYSDEYKMNYALVRVVDGTVTDAVIYKNYNR